MGDSGEEVGDVASCVRGEMFEWFVEPAERSRCRHLHDEKSQ